MEACKTGEALTPSRARLASHLPESEANPRASSNVLSQPCPPSTKPAARLHTHPAIGSSQGQPLLSNAARKGTESELGLASSGIILAGVASTAWTVRRMDSDGGKNLGQSEWQCLQELPHLCTGSLPVKGGPSHHLEGASEAWDVFPCSKNPIQLPYKGL